MSRAVKDWDGAAADAYSYLNEKKREYPKQKMWQLLDELAVKKSVTQTELLVTHGPIDLPRPLLAMSPQQFMDPVLCRSRVDGTV